MKGGTLPWTLTQLAVLVCAVAAQDAGPPRMAEVRGQVVDAATGAPVRRARVVPAPVGSEGGADPIFTDDQGRFTMTAAAGGAIRASKAGYATAAVALTPDTAVREMTVPLVRGAAIAGRVVDPFGAPFRSAFVTARPLQAPAQTGAAAVPLFTPTDGFGEYRLAGVPPGRYLVAAVRVPPDTPRGASRLEDLVFGAPERLRVSSDVFELTLAAGDEARDVVFSMGEPANTCPGGAGLRRAPGTATGTISGRVTSASGQPLACAVVRLVNGGTSIPSSYTDRQGRYAIRGLPAGSFSVEAFSSGYLRLQHGQTGPSDDDVPITLRAGEQRARVDFALPRQGIVSGTVTDEFGEPVEGVGVWAFRVRRAGGRLMAFSTTTPSPTDDRGRYRVTGLEPGSYLVAVMARGTVAAPDGEARGYAPVYYPGTTEPSAALRVGVEAGRDAEAVDVSFSVTRTAAVTGWVFDAGGRPLQGTVYLTPSARTGVSFAALSGPIASNGRFVFQSVPPGDYVVQGHGRVSGSLQYGLQRVHVDSGDPPPLVVVVSEPSVAEGHVLMEGATALEAAGLLVSVVPADADVAPAPMSELARASDVATVQGGAFRLPGVAGPGRIRITASSCESCYLKTAVVGATDAAIAPYDFGVRGGIHRDVQIIVSDAGGAIEGRASDDRGNPVRSFAAVAFATNRDLWFEQSPYTKSARARDEGSFRIAGLPPGEYFVAAVKGIDPGPFGGDLNDPDLLEQLASQAERVTIGEREQKIVTAPLARR